jgi:hypothetical protein
LWGRNLPGTEKFKFTKVNVGGYSPASEAGSINHQMAVLMSKNVFASSDVGVHPLASAFT